MVPFIFCILFLNYKIFQFSVKTKYPCKTVYYTLPFYIDILHVTIFTTETSAITKCGITL